MQHSFVTSRVFLSLNGRISFTQKCIGAIPVSSKRILKKKKGRKTMKEGILLYTECGSNEKTKTEMRKKGIKYYGD